MQTSPFGTINWHDVRNAGVHLLITAAISFVIYLVDYVFPQLHFTGNLAILTPLIATAGSLIKSALAGYQARNQ